MGRLWRVGMLPAALAAASIAAGCGGEDHPNEPRPPAPISLSAQISEKKVSISPNEFGAGIVVITVSNQTETPTPLVVEGEGVRRASAPIAANGTGDLKVELPPGEYELGAGDELDARPARLKVGPPRPSAQNELLQP